MGYKKARERVRAGIPRKAAKYIHLIYKNLQLSINNRKISTKTLYLYVFCVLVPVLVTNIIIVASTLDASRKGEKSNINNIADSVAHNISSTIESAAYVTVDLFASKSIRNFLDTQYSSRREFYQEYNRVFDYFVFYASSKQLIRNVKLYSDNPTMINGGRYFRTDTISSEEWYKKFIHSNSNMYVFPSYFNKIYDINTNRMISVVRRLNYNQLSNIEKFVKLDLNYNKILEAVKSSSFHATVYICHENKIIFNSDESDRELSEDYKNISTIPMNEIQLHKTYTSYGFDFDIYLKGYRFKYASALKDKLWLIALLFLADALIPAIVLTLFSNSITKRILVLGKYMRKVKEEEFRLVPDNQGKDEIGELLDNYNLMMKRMKDLIEYEYKSKLEQQELYLARQQAELQALYSQINPHFMFNVLENIRMRSVIKGEQVTSQMIESLAKLMRKSAEWGADLITIEKEISFTEDYLNLQKYRFGDDFNYKIRISRECYTYMIPSLVLVTLVENSCVHGLNREGHSGLIFISIYEDDSFLNIEVEDTGIGMEEEQVRSLEQTLNEADIRKLQNSASLGMLNASIRLKKYCGINTKIIIESEKQVGTCIIIKIPLENVIKNAAHLL